MIKVKKILDYAAKYIWFIAAGLIVLCIVFPWIFTSAYTLRIATTCMMYVAIALSLNLLTGFLGLMSMGHAVFFGIGAYTAAILATRMQAGMGTTMLAAMLTAGFFGFLLGLPVLKLKSFYLTIVTLGFCEIVRLVEINEMAITRGPLGIPRIPAPNFFGIDFSSKFGTYYVMLVLVILIALVIYSIVHSRIGLAITAIRDDDLAAEAMGIDVFKYKVMVFIISAMLTGVVGAFYAHYITFVDPSGFTTNASMEFLIMAIFGGLGSIPGTILGASILTILPETLRGLAEYRGLIYGILIVLMMMVNPDGLLGKYNFKYIRQRFSLRAEETGTAK